MGTKVPRALISTLLIAGVFFTPLTPAARAIDATATTTESIAKEQGTATSTEETQPIEETASTTSPAVEMPAGELTSDLAPTSVSPSEILLAADDEEAEEEEDPFILKKEELSQTEHLSLSLAWNEQVLTSGSTVSLPVGTPGNLQWSFTDHAPTPFFPPLQRHSTTFPDAIAASTLTFQIYRGEVGAATLIHSEVVPYGTSPEIPFTPLGEGHYIFVLSSTFPKDTYPPGLGFEEVCGGSGDMCVLYQTRIDDFTWFMEHGQALYDDFEDEIDAQSIVMEDGERINRMNRFRPMAFGMVEISIDAQTSSVSNVLFLPGIKGSRLYSSEVRCVLSVCNDKLWDPQSTNDIQDLFLTSAGKSSRPDIYVKDGDIIDSVYGNKIYDSFIKEMDDLQASTTYSGGSFKWKAAAYDWRLSLDDIINNGVERDGKIYYQEASSTPYIEQTLRELAANSSTGKVTIVAHSNGGLVTKALLSKLGDIETAALIDKIIFVGVPQTGAPQALGGLLFGDRENLPFITNAATARGLAENSPMAYHLMPSHSYLQSAQDPNHSIIGFSGSVLYTKERSAYGSSIDTVTELDDFLLAREGGRERPEADDATSANILNPGLINYANSTHTSLDAWIPPGDVELHQIAGWGVSDTISGIDMYDEQRILGVNIGYKRQYRPIFVEDGDGVVPVPSALMMSTSSPNIHRYWINFTDTEFNHGTMLEFADVKDFIRSRLATSTFSLPDSFTTMSPVSDPSNKKLIFQLHSPLTLGVYDSDGNYTGLNEDGSVSEEVSGATYGEFGDVKYLITSAGTDYELVLNAQSSGVFSLDIQERDEDFSTTTTFADVPTAASTTVRLTITNGIADASSLSVDTDGDGEVDIEIAAVAGETVQYAPPTSTTEEAGEPSSSSGSNKRSTQTAVTVALAPSTISVPTIVAAVPNAPNPRVLGAEVAETEASEAEILVTNQSQAMNQTASVYNAMSPLTEWLKTLLYNIWKGLVALLFI